jgi:hypothetical protein
MWKGSDLPVDDQSTSLEDYLKNIAIRFHSSSLMKSASNQSSNVSGKLRESQYRPTLEQFGDRRISPDSAESIAFKHMRQIIDLNGNAATK